ncbi:hypothetical protein QBC43DRAFT_327386 [Cladorrhinum sp. PSN259]|nr:hypothetical protein QBC43DRAFT_327386 [Cladorrhinum sp. PSN259]
MPSRQSSKPPPPPRSRGHGHSASTSSLASKLPFISSWASFSSTQKQQEQQPEIRLPPLEAFTFESFMSSQNDVSADLDRIAEICARSRYSLSNQYEVHVAPHGSGSSFVSSATTRNNRRAGGLHSRAQSVGGSGAEDDSSATGSRSQQHRGRRSGAGTRKKSVAYGTLETIMSSSRSSEEGDSKSEGNGKHKKSAGEVVDAVRGRAGKRNCGGGGGDLEEAESVSRSGSGGRKSSATSFANAIMESRSTTAVDASLHGKGKKKKENDGESEAAAAAVAAAGTGSSNKGRRRRDRNRSGSLVSEPALPRMTGSHLGVMTGIAHSGIVDAEVRIFDDEQQHGFGSEYAVGGGDFDGEWNTWVPWRAGDGAVHEDGIPALNAEGRLRQLLRNTGDGFGR